ncbi:hypothetical protein [Rufibacter latericius]|uniref:DUF4595 domain-containing protein n=1 Tax=Rufibacter latericius TaxID=2487040 RepID=A0A3M9MT49_9BACT|nr:hypothetical protein [Rufibacter latericius]RNI28704.1 hypothetical protein EFB08_08710 [Rufibacter latericius]
MKKLLLSISIALSLLGCKNETDPAPETEKLCRIVSIDPTYAFQYNAQNQLTTITVKTSNTSSYQIDLKYDAKGRLVRETAREELWENSYNAQDQLIQQTLYSTVSPGVDPIVYLHSYNSAGQRTQTISHLSKEPNKRLSLSTYSYTNGVLSSIVKNTYAYGGFDGSVPDSWRETKDTYTYVFDGKKNPLPSLPIMTFENYFANGYDEKQTPILFSGNVIRFTFKRESPNGGGSTNYTATYKYNEQGYPIESMKTQDGWVKTQAFYSYNCE